MTVPVTVSHLAIAAVKGMRLHDTSEIRLGQHGVTGDREFLVIGEDGKLLLTGRTPALLQIEPAWDRARDVLALRFPDGRVVEDTPEPGACAVTRMYDGREIPRCRAVSSRPGTRTQAPPTFGFCMRWPGCAARTTSPSASGATSSAPAGSTSVTLS